MLVIKQLFSFSINAFSKKIFRSEIYDGVTGKYRSSSDWWSFGLNRNSLFLNQI